jgi:hypothetical protein
MATSMAAALCAAIPELKRVKFICIDKCRFATREEAERHLTKSKSGWRLFFYHCENCGGYHITKRLQNHSAEVGREDETYLGAF